MPEPGGSFVRGLESGANIAGFTKGTASSYIASSTWLHGNTAAQTMSTILPRRGTQKCVRYARGANTRAYRVHSGARMGFRG
jgi:hypothetical protein